MTYHCGKIYPNSIPGIYYFETWWKSKCKSCKRDINIDTILTHEQQLEY